MGSPESGSPGGARRLVEQHHRQLPPVVPQQELVRQPQQQLGLPSGVESAQRLRLRVHEGPAEVQRCAHGNPWLGFVVFPSHWRVKARKVVQATRRLAERHAAWRAGGIRFAEFDASVQGWINHVGSADSRGLRRHALGRLPLEGMALR